MNADIHYTRSGDTSIAYKVGGKGPPDMVFVPGFVSHLEMTWESPLASRVWHRLASFGRIMTFDKHGTGLSDPPARVSPSAIAGRTGSRAYPISGSSTPYGKHNDGHDYQRGPSGVAKYCRG